MFFLMMTDYLSSSLNLFSQTLFLVFFNLFLPQKLRIWNMKRGRLKGKKGKSRRSLFEHFIFHKKIFKIKKLKLTTFWAVGNYFTKNVFLYRFFTFSSHFYIFSFINPFSMIPFPYLHVSSPIAPCFPPISPCFPTISLCFPFHFSVFNSHISMFLYHI